MKPLAVWYMLKSRLRLVKWDILINSYGLDRTISKPIKFMHEDEDV